jgi:hypothetical protein
MVDRSNHGKTLHCALISGHAIFFLVAFGGEYGRDNSGHDTLVIAKEEDT